MTHTLRVTGRSDLVPRRAEPLLAEALADTRVVLVNGARQAGKSTLTRLTAAGRPGATVRLLDDPATLTAATHDPTDFVDHDGLLIIDEIQLAPELLRLIKVAVDLDPTPGRYLLTGSSRILALKALPDALPGRMEIIELWPFLQGEIDREPDGFVDMAFGQGPRISHSSDLRRRDYLERIPRRSSVHLVVGLPSSTPTCPCSSIGTSSSWPTSSGTASC